MKVPQPQVSVEDYFTTDLRPPSGGRILSTTAIPRFDLGALVCYLIIYPSKQKIPLATIGIGENSCVKMREADGKGVEDAVVTKRFILMPTLDQHKSAP